MNSLRSLGSDIHGRAENSDVTSAAGATFHLEDSTRSTLDERLDAADLRSALDQHTLVATVDPSGRILTVSQRLCVLTQYSQEELQGRTFSLLNSGYHSKAFFRDLWNVIIGGGIWHGEIKNRAKDGSDIWVAATIVPLLDRCETPREYVALYSDVTVLKQAESALLEKLRLQRLLADLPSRFVAVQSERIDTTIQATLHLIAQILRLDSSMLWQARDGRASITLTHSAQPSESSGTLCRPLTLPELPGTLHRVMSGESVSVERISDLPPDASTDRDTLRQCGVTSLLAIPLIVNGRVEGALVLATSKGEHAWAVDEVTELKLIAQTIGNVIGRQRAERREEQLRAELAHATRIATLGELTATLVHELNQPLAAILSNAQAARRFIAAAAISQDELAAIFDDIVRADKRAVGIISNLRAMVSKTPCVREPCCLNSLIRDVVDLIHAELLAENINLQCTLHPNLPTVQGSTVELQQTLLNLLVNALHALKEMQMEGRKIYIETCVAGLTVALQIRDSGHGIPQERLPQIFEPFFTTKSAGLGMGLSICRRIIENHGGRISARNNDLGGASFSFWLPITTPPR